MCRHHTTLDPPLAPETIERVPGLVVLVTKFAKQPAGDFGLQYGIRTAKSLISSDLCLYRISGLGSI